MKSIFMFRKCLFHLSSLYFVKFYILINLSFDSWLQAAMLQCSRTDSIIKGAESIPDAIEVVKEGDVIARNLHEFYTDQTVIDFQNIDADLGDLVFAVLVFDAHDELHLVFSLGHFWLTLFRIIEILQQSFFNHIRIIRREELS